MLIKGNWQRIEAAKHHARIPPGTLPFQAWMREAAQQCAEGNFGFEAGKWRAQAIMDALTKGEMTIFCAANVERIRLGELGGIATRRSQRGKHILSRFYPLIAH